MRNKSPNAASASALDPLSHYIAEGEVRDFQPVEYFDTAWHRGMRIPADGDTLLGHCLRHRNGNAVSPLPEFDAAWYCETYPDIAAAGGGRIAYVSTPLNAHRRHRTSVTGRTSADDAAEEAARLHRLINARLDADAALLSAQSALVNELRS